MERGSSNFLNSLASAAGQITSAVASNSLGKEAVKSTPEYMMINTIAISATGIGIVMIIIAVILLFTNHTCIGVSMTLIGMILASAYPLLRLIY